MNRSSHYREMLYTLLGISPRLIGPLSSNGTGRVEVSFNGEWGKICRVNGRDIDYAGVVCRQLGYLNAVRAFRTTFDPDGAQRAWLSYIRCSGREKNLSSCTHSISGYPQCNYGQDVEVECSSIGNLKINVFLGFM